MNSFKRLLSATGAGGLLIGLTGAVPALATGLTATIGASCAMPGAAQTIAVHAAQYDVVHVEVTMDNAVVSATGLADASGLFTAQVTLPAVVVPATSPVRVWVLDPAGTFAESSSFSSPAAGGPACPSPSTSSSFELFTIDETQASGGLVKLTCDAGIVGQAQFTPTIQIKAYSPFSTTFTLPESVKLPLDCNGAAKQLPILPVNSVITLHESTVPAGAEPAPDTSITVVSTPVTTTIHNALADKITVTPNSGTAMTAVEGSLANQLVGKFTDTGRPGGGACVTEDYAATVNWGDGSSSSGTVTCEQDASSDHVATGVFDVHGSHRYADSGSYNVTLGVVDNSESGESSGAAVKTDAATVSDATFAAVSDNSDDGSYTAAEGKSVAVAVVFEDNRGSATGTTRDASITGTINWGDGTVQTVAPAATTTPCECAAPFQISGSHVYDAAAANYHITVTATDDGGQTGVARFQAKISDGTLTADANKSLSGVATTALTNVVGSFTDAAGAQAAVADFAAAIDWGDGSAISTGTLSQTASGAFSVSGTHTYAAAGSKSITATVTDQEGGTVTLHATATIAAAPIVLPATGRPQPGQPTAPLVLLALLVLGVATLAVGARFVGDIRALNR